MSNLDSPEADTTTAGETSSSNMNDDKSSSKHSLLSKSRYIRFMTSTASSSRHDPAASRFTRGKLSSSLAATSNISRAGNWVSSAAKRVGIRRTSNTALTGVIVSTDENENKRSSKTIFARRNSTKNKGLPPRPDHLVSKPLTSPPNKPLPATPRFGGESSTLDPPRCILDAEEKPLTRRSPQEPEKVEEWPTLCPGVPKKPAKEAGGPEPLPLRRNNPFNRHEENTDIKSQTAEMVVPPAQTPTAAPCLKRDPALQTIKVVSNTSTPASASRTPLQATSPNRATTRNHAKPMDDERNSSAKSIANARDSLSLTASHIEAKNSLKRAEGKNYNSRPTQLPRSKAQLSRVAPGYSNSIVNPAVHSEAPADSNKENNVMKEPVAVPSSRTSQSPPSRISGRSVIPTPSSGPKNARLKNPRVSGVRKTDGEVQITNTPISRIAMVKKPTTARTTNTDTKKTVGLKSNGPPASRIAGPGSKRDSMSSEKGTVPRGPSPAQTIGQIITGRINKQADSEKLAQTPVDSSTQKKVARGPLRKSSVKTPVRTFSTKRLSTASSEYGPTLKIYSSAEKVIMGDPNNPGEQSSLPKKTFGQGLQRTATKRLRQFGQNSAARNRSKSPLDNDIQPIEEYESGKDINVNNSHRGEMASVLAHHEHPHESDTTRISSSQDLGPGALNPKRLTPVREIRRAEVKPVLKHENLQIDEADIEAHGGNEIVANKSICDPFIDAQPHNDTTLGDIGRIASAKPHRDSARSSIGLDEAAWIAQRGSTLSRAITVSPVSSRSLVRCATSSSPVSSMRTSEGKGKPSSESSKRQSKQISLQESFEEARDRKMSSTRAKKESMGQDLTPDYPQSKLSAEGRSSASSSSTYPPRSSSRAPAPDFTIGQADSPCPKEDPEASAQLSVSNAVEEQSANADPPSEFVYRQNRLGAEYGMETLAFDPLQSLQGDIKRASTVEASKESSNSLPKSLFNVRGLFYRAPSAEPCLPSEKIAVARGQHKRPTILRGYPFPRTSEIHPIHRPTKSPGPTEVGPSNEPAKNPYNLNLTVPVTPAKEEPIEAEIDRLQEMAMQMMNRVKHEPRYSRRSDYLDISKIMVDTILNVREAKKAAEEAKAASRRAEVSQLLCEKHLREMMTVTSRIGDEMLRSSW